jgi:hypothetical protein
LTNFDNQSANAAVIIGNFKRRWIDGNGTDSVRVQGTRLHNRHLVVVVVVVVNQAIVVVCESVGGRG